MSGSLDINCDCGESFGKWTLGADEQLIPLASTASVACGWHAGDPATMRDTVALALRHGVVVGAHPGLPDLLGFGRRSIDLEPADLHAYIVYQAGALEAFLRARGQRLNHVKPHGALYPMLNAREDLARAAVDAFFEVMDDPILYWPAGSEDRALLRVCAERGVHVVREYYPDSKYGPDGETVVEHSRAPTDPDQAEAAFRRFLEAGQVEALDGTTIALAAESVCIHGDGPNAVAILERIRKVLGELDRPVRPATAPTTEGARA